MKDLRKLDDSALQKELDATLKEHFNLRMQNATGQLAQNHQLGNAKKRIARIKTLMTERAKEKQV